MRILLLGGGGQLGKTLISIAPERIGSESIDLISIKRKDLDLADFSACKDMVLFFKPDFVINSAAYTFVDKAESDSLKSFLVNAEAPKALAEGLKETGGKLIHFSTDYVFDGEKSKPYKPFDIKNPLNIYGKSKALGEDYIMELLAPSSQCFILRTSWLLSSYGNNFLLKMLKLLTQKGTVNVVFDQISSPTTTITLANACWSLINRVSAGEKPSNILHWTDNGLASWYDIAQAIAEYGLEFGMLNKPVKVLPINTLDYPLPAQRPAYSVLDLTESRKHFDLPSIYWRDSLKTLIGTLKD